MRCEIYTKYLNVVGAQKEKMWLLLLILETDQIYRCPTSTVRLMLHVRVSDNYFSSQDISYICCMNVTRDGIAFRVK